jgi:hypothetical protein
VNALDDAGFSPLDLVYCPQDQTDDLYKVYSCYILRKGSRAFANTRHD